MVCAMTAHMNHWISLARIAACKLHWHTKSIPNQRAVKTTEERGMGRVHDSINIRPGDAGADVIGMWLRKLHFACGAVVCAPF